MGKDFSSLGFLVDLVKSLLSSFSTASVFYIPRLSNKPARILADLGHCVTHFTDWFPNIPTSVLSAFEAVFPS